MNTSASPSFANLTSKKSMNTELIARLRQLVKEGFPSCSVEVCVAAAETADALEAADAEIAEQSRLNAMGQEREARLMARVKELESDLAKCEPLLEQCADAIRDLRNQRNSALEQVDLLKADKERMDWLDMTGRSHGHGLCTSGYGEYCYYVHAVENMPSAREAIDNARK